MLQLANDSVASIFTISTDNWTAINKRVGSVLGVEKIASVVNSDLPGYSKLLISSKLWKASTFNELITESNTVAKYAQNAIANFGDINQKVKKVSNQQIPENLQKQVIDALRDLQSDTLPIVNQSNKLSGEIHEFMLNNQTVDAEMEQNKEKLGSFWAPLGNIIHSVETATGKVNGAWKAILDDLNSTLGADIQVTMPFIASLELDAAIISWQSILSESSAFPSQVDGQESYWDNNKVNLYEKDY